ncbi:hypothetical protein [Streptomyces sp. XY332]|uniref:hypothetical protein n=1 Tax=Streptomyces sp. XY332 TaxID=1415561 RepID=UPI00131A8AE4|nr:hypothetical protein [Streptomyces sp. XY332]
MSKAVHFMSGEPPEKGLPHKWQRYMGQIDEIADASGRRAGHLDEYLREAKKIKKEANARLRRLDAGEDSAQLEAEIMNDVALMALQARAEAAAWRAEARKKEFEAAKIRIERAAQSRELDARGRLSGALIEQIDDVDLAETLRKQQAALDAMRRSSEASAASFYSLAATLPDLYAKQGDIVARKVSRIKWEFSLSRALRKSWRVTFGFFLLVLGVDKAIKVFELETWSFLILLAAYLAGEYFVSRFTSWIDEAYRSSRLRRRVICKVAVFKMDWRASEISAEIAKRNK